MSKYSNDKSSGKKHQNQQHQGQGSYQQRRPMNPVFADKLRGFRPTHHTNTLPRLTDYDGDGIDHINIYHRPETPLGKILSPFNESLPFIDRFFGKFKSRQGLYNYLLSANGDEAFRTMAASYMRIYAAERANMRPYYPNLKYFMATSLWKQIKNQVEILELIKDNQLPFDAYYTHNYREDDKVSRIKARPNSVGVWLVSIANVISDAVKKGVEPNFDQFIDKVDELKKLEDKIVSDYVAPPEPEQKPATPKAKKQKFKKPKSEAASMKEFDQETEKELMQDPDAGQVPETAVVTAAETIVNMTDATALTNTEGIVATVTTSEEVAQVSSEAITETIVADTLSGIEQATRELSAASDSAVSETSGAVGTQPDLSQDSVAQKPEAVIVEDINKSVFLPNV